MQTSDIECVLVQVKLNKAFVDSAKLVYLVSLEDHLHLLLCPGTCIHINLKSKKKFTNQKVFIHCDNNNNINNNNNNNNNSVIYPR